MVGIGDIIEISDSSLVLKVVSIEKFRKRSNKYGSFLKILEENPNMNLNNKTNIHKIFNNHSCSKSLKPKELDQTDQTKIFLKHYERREDDKEEYKIIYEEEESGAFKKNDDIYDLDLSFISPNEGQKYDNQEKLAEIREENSCEFELEDFLNNLNLNDDEEFPLDGKYFDNIYQDQLKTKKEKMDLIFQKIIKRQKKNKLEKNIPSIRSTEVVDNRNILRNSNFVFNLKFSIKREKTMIYMRLKR